jgi:hypothetical protein
LVYAATGAVAVFADAMAQVAQRPMHVAVFEAVLPAMVAAAVLGLWTAGVVRYGRLACGLAMAVSASAFATINGRQVHRHALVNAALAAVCGLLVVAYLRALARDPSSSRRRFRAALTAVLPLVAFAAFLTWVASVSWRARNECFPHCMRTPMNIEELLIGECLTACVLVAAVQFDARAAMGAVAAFFGTNLFFLGAHFGPYQHVLGLALLIAGLPMMAWPWLCVQPEAEAGTKNVERAPAVEAYASEP